MIGITLTFVTLGYFINWYTASRLTRATCKI